MSLTDRETQPLYVFQDDRFPTHPRLVADDCQVLPPSLPPLLMPRTSSRRNANVGPSLLATL